MKSETIAMCPRKCGTPLISTLKFSRAEFFCVTCGTPYGMFEVKHSTLTSELQSQYRNAKAWFDVHVINAIAYGERRTDCLQCQQGDNHRNHIDTETKEASEAAYKKLLAGRMPSIEQFEQRGAYEQT